MSPQSKLTQNMQKYRVKPATPHSEVLFSFAICQQPNPKHFVHDTQFKFKEQFYKNCEFKGGIILFQRGCFVYFLMWETDRIESFLLRKLQKCTASNIKATV